MPGFGSLLANFLDDVTRYALAGPGRWNDPDMLEVGNHGLTITEQRAQFSLWAELAAPLIAGNDLTDMSAETRAILTNRAVIDVDQDPLGLQASPVSSEDGHWVLTKFLANGHRAIVLFNATDEPAHIATSADAIGLGGRPLYSLTNLWTDVTT